MKVTRRSLEAAVVADIITEQQAEQLHAFLQRAPDTGASFNFTHMLYYLGGLIAIGAMTLFMNLGWEAFGGWGIFFIALAYAGVGLRLGTVFQRKGYPIPAGLCLTFVVALTPLAVYGIQQGLGWWPDDSVYREYHRYIQWQWLYMELATLAVGVLVAWRYRFPFLIMPIALTLWYLSMDVALMIVGGYAQFEFRAFISMCFGALMLVLAFWVDFRSQRSADYAFWLYLFGVIAFWGGLTAQDSDYELSKFAYFCLNLLFIALGTIIVRRVFVVFGAIGSCIYLGHLAWDVFRDSWLFPVVLSLAGLLIIYLGVLYQKHEKTFIARSRALLPDPLRMFLESKDRY